MTARMTGRRHRLACTAVARPMYQSGRSEVPAPIDPVVGHRVVGDRRGRVRGERQRDELVAGHDLGGVRAEHGARRRRVVGHDSTSRSARAARQQSW